MKTFTANQFTPTKWDTAEDKAKFANQFVKFVTSGFKQSLFTKAFYRRLSMTFGHIAHYNQYGFWDVFFTNVNDKVSFIEQTLRHPCYGQAEWTYCDVERALQTWLLENNVLRNVMQEAHEEQTASDLATLARLKKEYEPA
jgi:hypothetical protein